MARFASFKELCRYRTYYFPIIVDVDMDFDMRRIHPFKQKIVAQMLLDLQDMPWIKEAWLFGSSLQPYCSYGSDTDIAFKLDNEMVDAKLAEDRFFDWLAPLNKRDEHGTDFVNLDNVPEFCELTHNVRKGVRLK